MNTKCPLWVVNGCKRGEGEKKKKKGRYFKRKSAFFLPFKGKKRGRNVGDDFPDPKMGGKGPFKGWKFKGYKISIWERGASVIQGMNIRW